MRFAVKLKCRGYTQKMTRRKRRSETPAEPQDGSRKVTYITEVQKMEGDTIVLQDLFRFVQSHIDENGKTVGTFVSTGLQPGFMDKFRLHGVEVPPSLFAESPQKDYM